MANLGGRCFGNLATLTVAHGIYLGRSFHISGESSLGTWNGSDSPFPGSLVWAHGMDRITVYRAVRAHLGQKHLRSQTQTKKLLLPFEEESREALGTSENKPSHYAGWFRRDH